MEGKAGITKILLCMIAMAVTVLHLGAMPAYAGSIKAGSSSKTEEKTEAEKKDEEKSKKNREAVGRLVSDFNVTADTDKASETIGDGLLDFINVIVGLIAYISILGITLFTAVDLCYITMPIFRDRADAVAKNGSRIVKSKSKVTGEDKIRFVTDDAVYAVTKASMGGGNAIGIYLWKRSLAFILLAIVMYMLLTGNIYLITDVAFNFVSGIIQELILIGS